MLTNVLNLPRPIYEAVANDDYDRGESDITVTELIAPPRMVALRKKHAGEITEDAADRIYSLIGQSIHTILERAGETDLREMRLYADVDGWRLGGKFDHLALVINPDFEHVLTDYKVMSVWEATNGIKFDKIAQMNVLDWLCGENSVRVDRLQIVGIFRDWSKSKARYERDYPQRQVAVFDIEAWGYDRSYDYIRERIRLHKEARQRLPVCTDEERWKSPPVWAVMKEGNKKATKLCASEEEAKAFAETVKKGKPYVEFRPSVAKRCVDYCAVAEFCSQYQDEVRNG